MKKVDTDKALLKRFPEPLVLVVCQDKKGKVNVCPVGFYSLVAWKPKVWMVALYETHYSPKIIRQTKEFVVCIPSIKQAKDILYCGSTHGDKVNKVKNTHFQFIKSKFIKVPLIEDSLACFECKVIKSIKVKDHYLFFGQIISSQQSDISWQQKLYNWDDKNFGSLKLGKKIIEAHFDPSGN